MNASQEKKPAQENSQPNIAIEQVHKMHDEGVKLMNSATGGLQQAQELLGNALKAGANILGETHKDLKELYFDYASSLLKEMESHSDEILAPFMDEKAETPPPTPAEEKPNEEQKEEQDEIICKNSPTIVSLNRINQETKEESQQKDDAQNQQEKDQKKETEGPADQSQVVFQLLQVARIINQKQIKEEETPEKTLFLAQIHMKLGLLETMKDNLDQAFTEYQKSLELRKKVQDPKFSRLLAETYFMIGHLLSGISQRVNQSVSFLKDAKIILINCLRKELKMPQEEEVKNEKEFLLPKRDDLAEIKGLKETILDLNAKIIETEQDRPAKAEEIKDMLRSQFSALAAGFMQPSAERMANIKDLGVLVSRKKKLQEEKKKIEQESQEVADKQNNIEKKSKEINEKIDKEVESMTKANQLNEKRMKVHVSDSNKNDSTIKEIN